MIQNNPPESTSPPLFVILERLDMTPDGHFRPSAFIKLTKSFRTSGLLHSLPPEELKSFLTVLLFLTPNGDCVPSLTQLSGAMHVSQSKTKARMQRLAQFRFQEESLIVPTVRGDGQEAYALNHKLVPVIEQPIEEPKQQTIQSVPRARIIEYSRQRYAKTREEVERQIAEINGWDVPGVVPNVIPEQTNDAANDSIAEPATPIEVEEPQHKELRRRLQNLGIAPEQIAYLLANFEMERIEKQLKWLPFRRKARNPSAYLVAAIVHDYEEPIYRR